MKPCPLCRNPVTGNSTGWMEAFSPEGREGYICSDCLGMTVVPTTEAEQDHLNAIRRNEHQRRLTVISKRPAESEDL
jgi:hypothetical protein